MRVRLFIVCALVLGPVALAPARSHRGADHTFDTITANQACQQDFPDPRVSVVMCGLVMCGLDNPRGLAFLDRRDADDPREDKDASYGDLAGNDEPILQVFVMNADGTMDRPLTALPSENGHPAWGRVRMARPRAR